MDMNRLQLVATYTAGDMIFYESQYHAARIEPISFISANLESFFIN